MLKSALPRASPTSPPTPRQSEVPRALAQAASRVATPNVRDMGTLGGNLAQLHRCLVLPEAGKPPSTASAKAAPPASP